MAGIGTTARIATIGDVDQSLARFNLPDRQIPIRVMLDERSRGDLGVLRTLRVEGRDGVSVPLGAVADIRRGAGPARIDRLDRERKATVEAELNGLPLGEAMRLVAELPIIRNLPDGVREKETGDKETMRELFGGFTSALGAGVLLVYLVLVLLFGRLLQPLTILSALPLALGGALAALIITQKPLGVSAVIGILMLTGIVAKNSILLVEYAVLARGERGLSRNAAIAEAALKRARPIVMTTLAMCAGMLHTALGVGADTEFRSPMALVVTGGLITSTMLSLFFVPAAYSCMDQLEGWLTGPLGRGRLTVAAEEAVGQRRKSHDRPARRLILPGAPSLPGAPPVHSLTRGRGLSRVSISAALDAGDDFDALDELRHRRMPSAQTHSEDSGASRERPFIRGHLPIGPAPSVWVSAPGRWRASNFPLRILPNRGTQAVTSALGSRAKPERWPERDEGGDDRCLTRISWKMASTGSASTASELRSPSGKLSGSNGS
ncbi:efflux RND transporter permease subunit [Siccirubricoccus deserti]